MHIIILKNYTSSNERILSFFFQHISNTFQPSRTTLKFYFQNDYFQNKLILSFFLESYWRRRRGRNFTLDLILNIFQTLSIFVKKREKRNRTIDGRIEIIPFFTPRWHASRSHEWTALRSAIAAPIPPLRPPSSLYSIFYSLSTFLLSPSSPPKFARFRALRPHHLSLSSRSKAVVGARATCRIAWIKRDPPGAWRLPGGPSPGAWPPLRQLPASAEQKFQKVLFIFLKSRGSFL